VSAPAAEPSPLDVAALAEAVRRGDERAFNRLYDAYFPRLYRYLLVAARGQEELVRDALQETFVRVVRHLRPLPDEAALWRWLARVARTALIDLARKRRDAPAAPLDLPARATDQGDHERALLGALDRMVARLPEDERVLVEAHYLRGEAQAELAARLAVSRKSVESRLARIRRKLRGWILKELGDER
jgi:RNA polymerase sigma-70 factor (ECF subfamily)